MYKKDENTIPLLLFVIFLFLFALYFMGCATVQPQSCDDYLAKKVDSYLQMQMPMVNGGNIVGSDGVLQYLNFADLAARKIHSEIVVDTDLVAEEFKSHGFKQVGTCKRGDREWIGLHMVSGVIQGNSVGN